MTPQTRSRRFSEKDPKVKVGTWLRQSDRDAWHEFAERQGISYGHALGTLIRAGVEALGACPSNPSRPSWSTCLRGQAYTGNLRKQALQALLGQAPSRRT